MTRPLPGPIAGLSLPQRFIRLQRNANQTAAGSTVTNIAWDTVVNDPDHAWSGTNLVVPFGAVWCSYLIAAKTGGTGVYETLRGEPLQGNFSGLVGLPSTLAGGQGIAWMTVMGRLPKGTDVTSCAVGNSAAATFTFVAEIYMVPLAYA